MYPYIPLWFFLFVVILVVFVIVLVVVIFPIFIVGIPIWQGSKKWILRIVTGHPTTCPDYENPIHHLLILFPILASLPFFSPP